MEKEIESKAIEYLTGKPVERHHHEANYIVYQRPKSSNWFKIPTKEVNETIENHKESLKLQSRLPKSFSKMADGGGTKSAFDSTKEKMKDKTQQERIDSLIEFVSQSNWSSKPITVKDNMVIVFSKMYDLEPTRVASIFNKYQKKYAKGGGVGFRNIDKIKSNIGDTVFNHINTLNKSQLEKQLAELKSELKTESKNTERHNKLKDEEWYILYKLERVSEFKYAKGGGVGTWTYEIGGL